MVAGGGLEFQATEAADLECGISSPLVLLLHHSQPHVVHLLVMDSLGKVPLNCPTFHGIISVKYYVNYASSCDMLL